MRIMLLLVCVGLPACGTLRTANLLTLSAEPGVLSGPRGSSWKLVELNTACFETFPSIIVEGTAREDGEAVAAHYQQLLKNRGWWVSPYQANSLVVHGERKRTLPVFFAAPLVYRDESITISIRSGYADKPATIQIIMHAASHLDFPSAVLTWLTGNKPPLKYLL